MLAKPPGGNGVGGSLCPGADPGCGRDTSTTLGDLVERPIPRSVALTAAQGRRLPRRAGDGYRWWRGVARRVGVGAWPELTLPPAFTGGVQGLACLGAAALAGVVAACSRGQPEQGSIDSSSRASVRRSPGHHRASLSSTGGGRYQFGAPRSSSSGPVRSWEVVRAHTSSGGRRIRAFPTSFGTLIRSGSRPSASGGRGLRPACWCCRVYGLVTAVRGLGWTGTRTGDSAALSGVVLAWAFARPSTGCGR